jgi:tetratricopeptide (TPR) repeat protein
MPPTHLAPCLFACLAFLCTATLARAQVATPPSAPSAPAPTAPQAPAPTPAPAPPAPAAGTAGDYSSGTVERSSDKIFDVNRDSVNLENGTMKWKGQTFNLGDTRLLRSRIERYLATPTPTDDVVKHTKLLNEIETLLSPKTLTRKNFQTNYQKAWELLFKAAEFDFDAGSCLTIATLVEKTHRTNTELRTMKTTRAEMEKLRAHQSKEIIFKARDLEERRDKAAQRTAPKGRDASSAVPQEGSEAISNKRVDLARTDAEIEKTSTNIEAMEVKARLEFQSQIVAFLFQRRFKHAIIASSFYRYTFDASKHTLKVGDQQVKSMFPLSNFIPTIDSVDMVAREAAKDVETGVKTVLQLYDSGRRYKALERLQETFFLGEYEPQVMFFDPTKKLVLMEIWQNLQELQRLGDERDLNGVETILKKIETVASDFTSASVMSRVNNAKRASNLALFAAKQAAYSSDAAKVEQNLERATKLWPTNPAIEEFTRLVESRTDLVSQRLPEFDRLLREKKYRDIYTRKEELAPALIQDKERMTKMQEITNQVGKIDLCLVQVRSLKESGNFQMAWDFLEEAAFLSPEDSEIGKVRSELITHAAEYAAKLANASREEKAGNYSAALAWHLAAQDSNPGSEYCARNIRRTSKLILEKPDKQQQTQ